MAIIVFPVGNITVSGVMVYTIAGSFAANFQLTNDHIAPVSSIAGAANPWVYTDKYNRPCCICMLLNDDLSTFPTYLMSTGCISSLILLCICAYITELCSLITRWLLLVRSSFVMFWLL